MTTGRINQVTTFRSRFRGPSTTRVQQITRFRDAEFIISFHILKDPPQLKGAFLLGKSTSLLLEPANGITSFPILTCLK